MLSSTNISESSPKTAPRVRIAPSPTGDPHVGLAYITLFNYVFTKKHQGKLILRIEDTDQKRSKPLSEALMMESLRWLGLAWDEGPDVGGAFGPYRQSERQSIYQEHSKILLARKGAYYCFCSQERLDAVREVQKKAGETMRYDRHCRELAPVEVEKLLADKTPCVLRLKMPLSGICTFEDELRGPIELDFTRLDDQVLIKTDGFPTYHFANVVDDHCMEISHVIRAEEWIASTPKHVVLYEAFGWSVPKFYHMPLLRNADKSKISKRKNPVSLVYYKRKGILPKAMLNFLALMGWAYSADQEIFTLDDMLQRFDFKQVHLGGPVFDMTKLQWLNSHYLREMSTDEFVTHLQQEVFSKAYLQKIMPLCIERMETFDQFIDKNSFFFTGSLDYKGHAGAISIFDGKQKSPAALAAMFEALSEALDELYTWDLVTLKALLEQVCSSMQFKPKEFYMPIRLACTGRADSPPLLETLEVLGREMVRFRLRDAQKFLLQL